MHRNFSRSWLIATLLAFVLAYDHRAAILRSAGPTESGGQVAVEAALSDVHLLSRRVLELRSALAARARSHLGTGSRQPIAPDHDSVDARMAACEELLQLQPRLVDGIAGSGRVTDYLYSNLYYRDLLRREGVGTGTAQARAFFGLASNMGGLALLTEAEIQDAALIAQFARPGEEQLYLLMGLAGLPSRESIRDTMLSVLSTSPLEQIRIQALASLEEYRRDPDVRRMLELLTNDPSENVRDRARGIQRRNRAEGK